MEKTMVEYTTNGGKMLAPAYDMCRIVGAEYSEDLFRSELRKLKELGFKRVYSVVLQDGHPQWCFPGIGPIPGSNYCKTIDKLGNVNALFARIAKEEGLEPFATYKPYEGGGGITIPEGMPMSVKQPLLDATVGGNRVMFETFVAEHPDLRIVRKDDVTDEDMTATVDRITMSFMLDGFVNHRTPGDTVFSACTLNPQEDNFDIWVSKDNATYTLYEGEYKVSFEYYTDYVVDSNGVTICDGEKKNLLKVTFSGLNLTAEYPYAAVTLKNSVNYRCLATTMLKWFSGEKELKSTATFVMRSVKKNEDWLCQGYPVYTSAIKRLEFEGDTVKAFNPQGEEVFGAFNKYGFEFNLRGSGDHGEGWGFGSVYALGRGKSKYMHGTLCEGYEEVREYWLSRINAILDDGYVGIDVRLQNHSGWVCDPVNYGYNEPLINRYHELFGEEEIDYIRLMQVRGTFFGEFLEKAAEICHNRGAKIQINLNGAMENPDMCTQWNSLMWCAMPKVAPDWRRCIDLCDEVTMKDAHFLGYKEELGRQIKAYATENGKPVWIQCYIQQANGNLNHDFVSAAEADKNISGLMLYEYSEDAVEKMKVFLPEIGYGAH